MNNKQTRQQDCAEEMLKKAASHCLNEKISFNYPSPPLDEQDEQADLGVIFTDTTPLTSGNNAKTLAADINKLDKTKGYFVRTGKNNAGGHFRFLFWDKEKTAWTMFSSDGNQYSLMNKSGVLSEKGINDLVIAHGKWGVAAGEYSIRLLEANEQNIKNATNFLYHFRMLGFNKAIAKIFSGKKDNTFEKLKTHPTTKNAALLMMNFDSEKERLNHPIGKFIPQDVIDNHFYEISDDEMETMLGIVQADSNKAIALALEKNGKNKATLQYWLCVAFSHPDISNDQLIKFAQDLGLESLECAWLFNVKEDLLIRFLEMENVFNFDDEIFLKIFRAAADRGYVSVLDKLIERLKPEQIQAMIANNTFYPDILTAATLKGHIAFMEKLMTLVDSKQAQAMIAANDFEAFNKAASHNQVATMEKLMKWVDPKQAQAMIAARSFKAFTDAAEYGHIAAMEKMMAWVDPDKVREMLDVRFFFRPFSMAADYNQVAAMERLVKWLTPTEVQAMIDYDQFSIFRTAARKGHVDVMKLLIKWATPDQLKAMIATTEKNIPKIKPILDKIMAPVPAKPETTIMPPASVKPETTPTPEKPQTTVTPSKNKKSKTETIVGFFGGTGYDFDKYVPGYVTQQELGVKRDQKPNRNNDVSFSLLANCLDDSQKRFGYDGCQHRGGGLFAKGIKEPSDHLLIQIRNKLALGSEKIHLVLTAHSRGCLSALDLAKQIGKDPKLKDKVDITLDLRDPVPGNFRLTASLDVAKVTSVSAQLRDLRACTNIKQVKIAIQEKGIIDIGFDVLIPRFSPHTKVEVENIPGVHDIQERADYVNNYHKDKKCYLSNTNLFLLGVCKSLQAYSEAGVNLNYAKCLSYLELIEPYTQPEMRRMLQEKFNFIPTADTKLDISKKDFEELLEKFQILFYERLLNDYKNHPERKLQTRHVHFGGEFKPIHSAKDATHLNERHASLVNKNKPIRDVALLLDFEGTRLDLNKRQKLNDVIAALQAACEKQLKHETHKGKKERVAELKELMATIKKNPFDLDTKLKQCDAFIKVFQRSSFNQPSDKQGKTFRKNILHIFASLITFGIYAGVRALHSYRTRGYAKFWQTRKEAFIENVSDRISLSKKLK